MLPVSLKTAILHHSQCMRQVFVFLCQCFNNIFYVLSGNSDKDSSIEDVERQHEKDYVHAKRTATASVSTRTEPAAGSTRKQRAVPKNNSMQQLVQRAVFDIRIRLTHFMYLFFIEIF